ncbi:MAG TPA: L-threonylcarbamoyladenylate synthase [Thermoanaerobaculia bacterium]|nr:L-threonylcarbamoyladenylate synthase [Thermoanaerobaculia bacterium]
MAVERWRWGDPVEIPRRCVERGGLLAIPTESSYGLGVDPRNREAVDGLFALKNRPANKALPVVAASMEQLEILGIEWRDSPLRPLLDLWPAPLSILLPLRRPLPATAMEPTVAVRIPEHPRLRSLLLQLGTPLTATSANLSSEAPILEPDEVANMLVGTDSLIVDDGPLAGGLPSTIVGWAEGAAVVIRSGRFPSARIASVMAKAERGEG